MAYAAVNGLKMYYEVDGDRSPLLLLHGGGGPVSEKWTSDFSPRFRVIAPQQMGYRPGQAALERWLSDSHPASGSARPGAAHADPQRRNAGQTRQGWGSPSASHDGSASSIDHKRGQAAGLCFFPILKRDINARLPALTGGAKALHHVLRQPDRDALLGGRFLWPTAPDFAPEGLWQSLPRRAKRG